MLPQPKRRAIPRMASGLRPWPTAGTTAATRTSWPPMKNAIASRWRKRIACHNVIGTARYPAHVTRSLR